LYKTKSYGSFTRLMVQWLMVQWLFVQWQGEDAKQASE
jgi:hypothetical protein